MSYIISGLNIKNVFEYDPALSYSQYDIIDYQFVTGISVYPGYDGFGIKPALWFNNDNLSSFALDTQSNISGWLNLVSGSGNLYQLDSDAVESKKRPYVDFNEQYINIDKGQYLTGTGFVCTGKTIMMVVDCETPSSPNSTVDIFQVGDTFDSSNNAYIQFKSLYTSTGPASSVILSSNGASSTVAAKSKLFNSKNIITVTASGDPAYGYSDYAFLRLNGILAASTADLELDGFWNKNKFKLGNASNNAKIKYYEFLCFTGVLTDTQLDYYEKYFYEKYFDSNRLYFAKKDVPTGKNYAPIFNVGQNYWTQDIDELFTLSYGSSVNFSAKLSALQFGDGYKSNTINNVNPLHVTFDLNYDGLTDKQAKCLMSYFENTPETKNKSNYEGYKGVEMDLFTPYKKNAELYFKNINHTTPYNNIHNIKIQAESLYDSILDYRGMLVQLDEDNIKTYPKDSSFSKITYNDVFYFNSSDLNKKGYYFYTGSNYNSDTQNIIISSDNSPTGVNSYFTKNFYFKGDIDYGSDSEIRIVKNELKNSTVEYEKDGINYNLLQFTVNFKKRSTQEARALLKFLDDKAGYKIFKYTLPQPYNKEINVYCPEWNHTYNFYDNHDISVKFIEFKNPST